MFYLLNNQDKMIRTSIILFLLAFSISLFGQSGDVDVTTKDASLWKTLAKITYKKEYDEFLGFKIDKPVFAESVTALQNQEVTVKGYIIPVEGYKSHKEFIFSAYPYNMCFFCGGAGPETVMEVESSVPVDYTAEQVTLTGKLQLNADDINRLMYQLIDAKPVKE